MPKNTETESARKRREEEERKRKARKLLGSGKAGRAADAIMRRNQRLRDI